MRTRVIIAASILATLAATTLAEARSRRVIYVDADTIVIRDAVRRDAVRVPAAMRPTKAAVIACQMGPNFLGAAWRGKRYRPFTRTGRPRICLTG